MINIGLLASEPSSILYFFGFILIAICMCLLRRVKSKEDELGRICEYNKAIEQYNREVEEYNRQLKEQEELEKQNTQ